MSLKTVVELCLLLYGELRLSFQVNARPQVPNYSKNISISIQCGGARFRGWWDVHTSSPSSNWNSTLVGTQIPYKEVITINDNRELNLWWKEAPQYKSNLASEPSQAITRSINLSISQSMLGWASRLVLYVPSAASIVNLKVLILWRSAAYLAGSI